MEMQELVDKLNYYTKLYDEGQPAISDEEWDNMYFQLQDMEKTSGIYLPDSPTQKVNYQVVNELTKVQHNHPMLSLDKTKSIDEINSFIGNKDYVAMAKLDGLTCSLKYVDGQLISAETRGNGIEGEDILHNALVVKTIPKRIDFNDELIVDGEIICTYQDFEPFADNYKNPRNFASGSIRLLDSKECANRNLTFVAWDCIEGLKEDSLIFKLDKLYELGFQTVPYTTDATREYEIKSLQELCAKLGYPIDGLVYKYDKVSDYEAAGKTDHHFKGGLAYKFYDEEYPTYLRDIEWTMGRTGKLSPVAIFDTVDIDGTEVSRANLHNISIMEDTLHGTGWRGQPVSVAKMNMIIPQIMSASSEKPANEDDYLLAPITCPICDGVVEIIQDNESKVLYCTNPNCEGKLINRIEHFFGKKGLNAKGISKATIEKLIDWGWVNGIKDMFTLDRHKEEWKNKAGFGERSVTNILESINNCVYTDLESIIAAAGIPLVGRTVARDLSKRYISYGEFKKDIEGDFDFSSLDGFGYEMNKSLKNFDFNELDYIVENYLTIQNKIEANNNNKKLENLTFCITGKITNWKNRDELVKYIEDLGGKCVGSVSANVNYLINNDIESTSAKNKKAKELNIEIINEQTFIKKFDLEK